MMGNYRDRDGVYNRVEDPSIAFYKKQMSKSSRPIFYDIKNRYDVTRSDSYKEGKRVVFDFSGKIKPGCKVRTGVN